jgi:Uma2 family endonuclease
MSDMALLSPRLFTVAEYHRMVKTGILNADERVELLDGLIVQMSPIGKRHWLRHALIVKYLITVIGEDQALVVPQGSFPLGKISEPQPDIAILAPMSDGSEVDDPQHDEIFAFIEISDTSFKNDVGLKRRLYASNGVIDYLVVDVKRNVVRHYSKPQADGYEFLSKLTYGDSFGLTRLPGLELAADPFLRAR